MGPQMIFIYVFHALQQFRSGLVRSREYCAPKWEWWQLSRTILDLQKKLIYDIGRSKTKHKAICFSHIFIK